MTSIQIIRYFDNGFRCVLGEPRWNGMYWDQTMRVIPYYHDVSEIIEYPDITNEMRIIKFIRKALE